MIFCLVFSVNENYFPCFCPFLVNFKISLTIKRLLVKSCVCSTWKATRWMLNEMRIDHNLNRYNNTLKRVNTRSLSTPHPSHLLALIFPIRFIQGVCLFDSFYESIFVLFISLIVILFRKFFFVLKSIILKVKIQRLLCGLVLNCFGAIEY